MLEINLCSSNGSKPKVNNDIVDSKEEGRKEMKESKLREKKMRHISIYV